MTTDSSAVRQRFPAQSVIEQLLYEQGSMPPLSWLARLFGGSPLGVEGVPRYLGAKGEITVGALLETLPPEWIVFHAIPIAGRNSDIDHLVVGPGGIFTITSMCHVGATRHSADVWVGKRIMLVAGRKVSHLRDSECEAERVTHLVRERMPLLTPVQPVIALVDPKRLTIADKPEQVKVIDAQDLRRWLVKLHPVLSAGEVQEVSDLVDSPNTWRPLPLPTADDDLMERFTALDAQVRSAGIRRLLWVLVGAATAIGVSIVVLHALEASQIVG
ncbi:NERD domain-containing protein [Cryobacterium algoritolerans]|uniref:NERD domain-containing protein n=1 Tax=Cryobacterium algoritolerans TaxID=1259184 RepID=A0A4R8WW66_9MICO|nr:nuclease-related domain-containing protein [Cryobacterium algoritolerans]TFC17944.1 NERD domain-containing protein [Cryobacterium algoritolerans]